MAQRSLRMSVLATLLMFTGGVSAQAADEVFTVRVENVSVPNLLKLSNGKTASVTLGPVLLCHPHQARAAVRGRRAGPRQGPRGLGGSQRAACRPTTCADQIVSPPSLRSQSC
jgi:hypothetical protein